MTLTQRFVLSGLALYHDDLLLLLDLFFEQETLSTDKVLQGLLAKYVSLTVNSFP